MTADGKVPASKSPPLTPRHRYRLDKLLLRRGLVDSGAAMRVVVRVRETAVTGQAAREPRLCESRSCRDVRRKDV